MAGAASAGASTGGLVDFLLQALQAWQEAKESGETSVPDREVQIRVAAGASAGVLADITTLHRIVELERQREERKRTSV